jgi:uncharacterized OB-fold protein
MAPDPVKFLPTPTPATEVFWQGCQNHQLWIQHCKACDHFQFYPRPFCTECMRSDPEWVQASGRGVVQSYTVVRTPVAPAYADDIPYAIVLVTLDEGPVMMSQMTACDVDGVEIGLRVEVEFEAWSEAVTMPLFKPAAA